MTRAPAITWRNKHVIITSKRRFDVIITCLLRCVFAGEFPTRWANNAERVSMSWRHYEAVTPIPQNADRKLVNSPFECNTELQIKPKRNVFRTFLKNISLKNFLQERWCYWYIYPGLRASQLRLLVLRLCCSRKNIIAANGLAPCATRSSAAMTFCV